MTTQLNLTWRTAVVVVGQSIGKLGQLIAALIFVRLLEPESWKTCALALSIYGTAVGLGGLNLQQGIFFFYARIERNARRNFVFQTTILMGITAFITAGIVWGLAPFFTGSSFSLTPLLPWIALTVLLEIPTQSAPQILIAAERPFWSTTFTSAMTILQVASLLLPIVLGYGIDGAVRGLALYAAIRAVFFLIVCLRFVPPGPLRPQIDAIKEQLIYTAPLGFSIATTVLNRNIDKWYVAAFDPKGFGAYALAAQEVPLIPVLPYAIGAVVATRIVHAYKRDRKDRVLEYWYASTSRICLIVVPATLAVIVCAPQLVALLFTKNYLAATLPFQIYTFILLHRIAEYGSVLRAAGDTRSLWWASFLLLLSNAILSLPLTMIFGMVGAAVGAVLANIVAWLFILSRIARTLDIGITRVLPWRTYRNAVIASVLSASIVYALQTRLPEGTVLQVVLKSSIFLVTYIALVRVFGLTRSLPEIPTDDEDFQRDLLTYSGEAD
jgi:O-antigen/teichoic acid export membrane protein